MELFALWGVEILFSDSQQMTSSPLSLHRWHLFWMASLPISLKSLLSLTADTHMNMKEDTSRFGFLRLNYLGIVTSLSWRWEFKTREYTQTEWIFPPVRLPSFILSCFRAFLGGSLMSKLFGGATKCSKAFEILKYERLSTPEFLTRRSQFGNVPWYLHQGSAVQSGCLPCEGTCWNTGF